MKRATAGERSRYSSAVQLLPLRLRARRLLLRREVRGGELVHLGLGDDRRRHDLALRGVEQVRFGREGVVLLEVRAERFLDVLGGVHEVQDRQVRLRLAVLELEGSRLIVRHHQHRGGPHELSRSRGRFVHQALVGQTDHGDRLPPAAVPCPSWRHRSVGRRSAVNHDVVGAESPHPVVTAPMPPPDSGPRGSCTCSPFPNWTRSRARCPP